MTNSTKSKLLQGLGIVLILEIGLIHLLNAQAEYEEVSYMGWLFVANFTGALIAALGIYRKQLLGWMVGLVVAIGSIVGYSWSRTRGMPGMQIEAWLAPYGIVALALEGIYLLLIINRPWRLVSLASQSEDRSILRYLLPSAGFLALMSISILAYFWDATVFQAYGSHVGSIKQVRELTATDDNVLTNDYGIQVIQVATSMMGGIADVRLRILDPNKAHAFLQNQAAMLVGDQALILAPHMHSHAGSRLKPGQVFVVFFPTEQLIQPGTEVSLVFGKIRTETVLVK